MRIAELSVLRTLKVGRVSPVSFRTRNWADTHDHGSYGCGQGEGLLHGKGGSSEEAIRLNIEEGLPSTKKGKKKWTEAKS